MLLHSLWLAQTRVFLSHPICPNSHMPHLFDFFFFFGCTGSLLLGMGFLQLWHSGFSYCRAWTLEHPHGLTCSARAQLPHIIWDPSYRKRDLTYVLASPEAEGGFLTIGLLKNPCPSFFIYSVQHDSFSRAILNVTVQITNVSSILPNNLYNLL